MEALRFFQNYFRDLNKKLIFFNIFAFSKYNFYLFHGFIFVSVTDRAMLAKKNKLD